MVMLGEIDVTPDPTWSDVMYNYLKIIWVSVVTSINGINMKMLQRVSVSAGVAL